MKRNKSLGFVLFFGILIWLLLTTWMEKSGPQEITHSADFGGKTALIVYNPDPSSSFDAKICNAFAKGLQQERITTKLATNKKIKNTNKKYDLYVFCANTYNFAPDKGIRRVVDSLGNIQNADAVAITIGLSSTKRSKRKFENFLNNKGFHLIDSKEFWKMRPNDKANREEDNVQVAIYMAEELGIEIGKKIK